MRLVGVTSCPTGIAHTYMAAEALEQAAKEAGHEMLVETQGSAGSSPLPQSVIDAADAVIFAHDLEVRDAGRFAGKPTIDVGVKKAISDGPALIAQAVAMAAETRAGAGATGGTGASVAAAAGAGGSVPKAAPEEAHVGTKIRQWLMTGVSYMIPFVAAGGILIALGFMLAQVFGGETGAIDVTKQFSLTAPTSNGITNIFTDFNPGAGMHWAALLFLIGASSFQYLVPILSAFIAFGIADRPGLVPGLVGGYIAGTIGAGFLGGIVSGFIAGFVARWIAGWKVHKGVRGIMPVVVIPLISTLVTGAIMLLVLGRPIKWLMDSMTNGLNGMTGASVVVLGLILGAMMGFDFGGPVNKTAYTFATAGLSAAGAASDSAPLKIMAAVMAAGMVAPLAMALATRIRPQLFSNIERENGKAAWLLGASFISEGAIPFAAADPARVIPSSVVGSSITGALAMVFGCTLRAPHGGIWVLPLIGNFLLFLVAIAVGVIVMAAIYVLWRGAGAGKPTADQQSVVAVSAVGASA